MLSSFSALKKIPFWVQVIVGLVLGVALGFVARQWNVEWLNRTLLEVGNMFVQLLKLAVPPLVFTAILVSVVNLRNVTNAARLATRTLLWFLATSLIAVAIGLAIGLITKPGDGVNLNTEGAKAPENTGSWLDFITGIVPTNVFKAFSEGNVLQIVFLAIVLGAAILAVGEKAMPAARGAEVILEIVQKALWWIIRLAPLGTLGLIGKSVSQYGWDLLKPFSTFTIGIYVGCALVMFGVYPLLLAVFAKVNPVNYFKGAWPALQLAFVSRSSVGTMPVTLRVTQNLGVPKEYASFAVPFGSTTKMDGCASIYPALAAIFVSGVYGIDLSIRDYVMIVVVSVIGSAATAGLTGAIVMATLTVSTVGLPLEGVGLLLAIDAILDMIRTSTNVAGQIAVPIIVSAREKTLDLEKYNNPKGIYEEEDTDEVTPSVPLQKQGSEQREPVPA